MTEIPYTFDTFVVGDGNNLCFAVCKGISEAPGHVYNPLFIYGKEGVGKTHLLRAIGNAVLEKTPSSRVMCLEVQKLVARLRPMDEQQVADLFRGEFKGLHLLLLDDLQVLAGQEDLQQRFVRAFNVAFSNGTQIVMTCDRHPEDVLALMDQLRSRGLITDIQPPDYECRMAIIRKKADAYGLKVDADALEFLARSRSGTVKEATETLEAMARQGAAKTLSLQQLQVMPGKKAPVKARGMDEEYASFLEEMQEQVGNVVAEAEEEKLLREEYGKTLYFWEMKGYDTSRLKEVMKEDLEVIRREFSNFRNAVERLIELEATLGSLNTTGLDGPVKEIEDLLYKPDLLPRVEEMIENLKNRIQTDASERAGQEQGDEYSFQSFVVGECNQMAYAATRLVARSPAKKYNPLFLWGGTGMGKTHLLHSIRKEMLENDPVSIVMYVTAERFTNELIRSIEDGTLESFRAKYRRVDALLIDDIQFLAGKDSTQQEFFHSFNALYSANRQIVITSDRSPKKLSTLEERLRSRFQGGLVVQIQPPDLKTRIGLIRKLGQNAGVILADEAILVMAEHAQTNMREVCGAFNKIAAYSGLTKKRLDPLTIRKILEDQDGEVPEEPPKQVRERRPEPILPKPFEPEGRPLDMGHMKGLDEDARRLEEEL